mmetsp:Transcript_42555/g.103293  ORF Transcript_42555/g.103293 Transcript_42555/m.103293 type:complete len:227 (-) Transcript_42555:635-1315(-)
MAWRHQAAVLRYDHGPTAQQVPEPLPREVRPVRPTKTPPSIAPSTPLLSHPPPRRFLLDTGWTTKRRTCSPNYFAWIRPSAFLQLMRSTTTSSGPNRYPPSQSTCPSTHRVTSSPPRSDGRRRSNKALHTARRSSSRERTSRRERRGRARSTATCTASRRMAKGTTPPSTGSSTGEGRSTSRFLGAASLPLSDIATRRGGTTSRVLGDLSTWGCHDNNRLHIVGGR